MTEIAEMTRRVPKSNEAGPEEERSPGSSDPGCPPDLKVRRSEDDPVR